MVFPGLTSEVWPFDSDLSAWALFNGVSEFVEHIGVLPSYPVRTARTLFEKTDSKLVPMTADNEKFWEPFSEPETDFIWCRKALKAERSRKLVAAFDKRSMYLSAMSEKMFSYHGFVITEPGELHAARILPGVYDCKISFPRGFFLRQLFPASGLYYSNTIRFLIESGCTVTSGRAWVFNHPERIFSEFYKTVSTAKKKTSGSDSESTRAANGAIKSCYTQFIGWLRSVKHAEGWAGLYYRPDFHGLIVSLANANLLRNVREVERLTGMRPFGFHHDTVYYFCDDLENFNGTPMADNTRFSFEWARPAAEALEILDHSSSVSEIRALGDKHNGEENRKAAAG